MPRKRVTQIFPFLLPLRKWQRKHLFYIKMNLDRNIYTKEIKDELLPHKVFETSSLMLNENSGFDIKYQMNKVHNLKVVAKTLNKLAIKPNETFSFYQAIRYAERYESFKDGLTLVDGKIIGSSGGGLCQISNMLFWMFLHTPLTIVERHGHGVSSFPTTEDLPCGIDATISEGWLDLKVKNETPHTFQIAISFDDKFMYGRIFSNFEPIYEYHIFNKNMFYYREKGKVFQNTSVDCDRINKSTKKKEHIALYNNICEIGYRLPDNIKILEKGD